jgi:uncharacterized protein (DUF1499 family)
LKFFFYAVGVLGAFAAMLVLAGQLGWLRGQRPADLGVKDGRLAPPSLTDNSVSSQTDLYPDHPSRQLAAIQPFPAQEGNLIASMQRVSALLEATPGITIVTQRPDYIHAEAETRWMRFVDDLEFWANPTNGNIEVRSASRLGNRDFGVNRRRLEALRARYEAGAR